MSALARDRLPQNAPALSLPTDRATRTAIDIVLIMLALLAPTLVALAFDERQINGAAIWMKPMHFQLALIAHFAGLALLLQLLAPAVCDKRVVRWSMTIGGAAAVAEIGWIMVQAARGRASHFNEATSLEAGLYMAAGLGAATIVICAAVIGVTIWRRGRLDVGPGLRLGAVFGLTLGAVATLIVAGAMASGRIVAPGHWVGGLRSDATGLPFLGWSTTGGDLRVPHFFATHAMQALPLVGLAADRVVGARAKLVVWAATALWAALVAATFIEALRGAPLI
jgi:hypothetical protein